MTETSKMIEVNAPARPTLDGNRKSVFLAGTTSSPDKQDWRSVVKRSLANLPLYVFDPSRADWDHTWKEDASAAEFSEQVTWELDMQELADVVVVFFHPASQAPISLLELGISARSGKVIVVCPEGYWKRGNVQVVCLRYGIPFLNDIDHLKDAIVERTG